MARKHGVPLVYVNQFGGNDDLVFDGRSCVFDADGAPIARGRAFDADVVVCDLDRRGADRAGRPIVDAESEIWRALVLGTRDYARKCGFTSAVLGLSGGIDSALTAAIAAEALGADDVLGVLMPSPYSSQRQHRRCARSSPRNLGIETLTLPIEPAMQAYRRRRSRGAFAGDRRDVTEENIQARIRGNLLMALSNKRGALLLTTGNKSELAVGYCTLYGDMSGGLARDRRRAEDDGLPRRALAERNRPARRHSRSDADQGAVGGAAARTRPTRIRCRPTTSSTTILAAPHRAAPAGRRDRRRRIRRRDGRSACCGWCDARSSNASRRRPD